MTLEHFKVVISIVQVIIVPLMAAGLAYMNRLRSSIETTRSELQQQIEQTKAALRADLHEIATEVRKTNGRLIEVETWRREHDNHDGERFNSITDELRDLRRAVMRRGGEASQ